jgi:hypothetical protein
MAVAQFTRATGIRYGNFSEVAFQPFLTLFYTSQGTSESE